MNAKPEEIYIVIILGTAIMALLGGFIVYFIFSYRKKQKESLLEKELLQASFQQQLLQSQIEIQEQAFSEISRELHDNVGQQLTLAKLHLNSLKNIDDNNADKVDTAKELISNSLQDIRSISKTLLGEKINQIGLPASIEAEAERVEKLGRHEVSFAVEGDIFNLDAQKEIILFRIVQEALSNIAKHAEASAIDIRMQYSNYLTIFIIDNGKGFDSHATAAGIGLLNMKSRAAIINTHIQIESKLNKGTIIEIIYKNT